MLKHEDSLQTTSQPAAQVRVTPEELVAAITAVQIRKEGQPGTIAIGDAVEELGLNVTPEEVLAEVQARRQEPKPRKKRDYWALACAGVCVSVLATLGIFVAWPAMTMPVAQHISIDQNTLTVKDASDRQVFLSEVPDNHIFHCRLQDSNIPIAASYLDGDTSPAWSLIKHNGKFYVRGWMPKVSNQVLQTEGTSVSVQRTPQDSVAVTLPVEGFKVAPMTGGVDDNVYTLWAENIHLDKYAYEKW